MFGDYEWPETKAGEIALLPCVYVGDGESPMASRTCFSMGNWSSDPNFGECSTRITMYTERGFCDVNVTSNSMFGDYDWPETKAEETALLPCVYAGDGESPMASRTCFSTGNWSSDPNFGECSTRITVMYQSLDSVSSALRHMTLHTEFSQKCCYTIHVQ